MKKRLLAILLTLCMLIGLLPATALAAGDETPTGPELDISEGSITITDTGYKLGNDTTVYSWGKSNPNHKVTITQSDPNTPVSNYIEVQSGTAEITLKGVNLTNSSRSPFLVNGNGTEATVILEGKPPRAVRPERSRSIRVLFLLPIREIVPLALAPAEVRI